MVLTERDEARAMVAEGGDSAVQKRLDQIQAETLSTRAHLATPAPLRKRDRSRFFVNIQANAGYVSGRDERVDLRLQWTHSGVDPGTVFTAKAAQPLGAGCLCQI